MKNIVSLALMAVLISACSSPTPLPTSIPTIQPTNTPYPTSTPIPPTAVPQSYVIPAGTFPLDTKENCSTDTSFTAINKTSFDTSGGILSMRNGKWVLWCPGARHTWVGTLSYKGFTFASDASDPLRFMMDSQGGYQYIGGKGKVTQSDKQLITLPLSEVSPTETPSAEVSTVATLPTELSPTSTFPATLMINDVDPAKILESNGFIYIGRGDETGCTSSCNAYDNKDLGLEVYVYADRKIVFSVSFDAGADKSAQSKVTNDLIQSIYGSEMNSWINGKNATVLKGSPQDGIVGNFTTYMEFYKDLDLLVIVITPVD